MVLEVQFPIARLHLPIIVNLAILDLHLQSITILEISKVSENKSLGHDQGPQRKAVSQVIWNFSVYLTRNDTSRVSHGLLQPDSSRASVVRSKVDVKPGYVQSGPGVHGNGAEEGSEEVHGVISDGDEQDVPDDTEDVG